MPVAYDMLKGTDKVAVMMQVLDKDTVTKLLKLMDESEVRQISQKMAVASMADPSAISKVIEEFNEDITKTAGTSASFESTEQSLMKIIEAGRVNEIMDEIRHSSERSTWEKLAHVQDDVLARYLSREHPQTVAVVLSKIKPKQAASMMNLMPEDIVSDVLKRMLKMDTIRKDVLIDVERTLKTEFVSSLAGTPQDTIHTVMAEIFNRLERGADAKFLGLVQLVDPQSAERIRGLMFTFDDLAKLSDNDMRILLKHLDRQKIAYALKSAPENLKSLFFKNMPERASKLLRETIVDLGAVMMSAVMEAQNDIVLQARELANRNEIHLKGDAHVEMVN